MANALGIVTPMTAPMTAAGFAIAKVSGGSTGPFMQQNTDGHVLSTAQLYSLWGKLHHKELECAQLQEENLALKAQIAKQAI